MNEQSKFSKNVITTCLAFVAIMAWNGVAAQSDSSSARVEKGMFKVYLDDPTLGYEYGLSKANTLYAEVGLNFFSNITLPWEEGGFRISGELRPAVRAEMRHYYDLKQRQQLGKRWRGNTGPFLGGMVEHNLSAIWRQSFDNTEITGTSYPITQFGFLWGYQHTDPKLANLHFTFVIGPALSLSQNRVFFHLGSGYVKLGFAFGDFDEKK